MAFEADAPVVRLRDINIDQARHLLGLFDLELILVPAGEAIPGSFWGECEAGLIGSRVHARLDTPVHSLLHEACHLIVMPAERRASVHTDATDSVPEEDAACYLQLLLAERLDGFDFERACADMDLWGYSFRLGSARAWFEQDAEDACEFLNVRGILPLPLTLPARLQHHSEA
jgi:hypothetical protein